MSQQVVCRCTSRLSPPGGSTQRGQASWYLPEEYHQELKEKIKNGMISNSATTQASSPTSSLGPSPASSRESSPGTSATSSLASSRATSPVPFPSYSPSCSPESSPAYSRETSPASSQASSSVNTCASLQVHSTDQATRQFLNDIALMFSRDRKGSRSESRGEKLEKASSYVTATMLSRRTSAKEGVLLTIHVALNTIFSRRDRDFGARLVEFLNKPPSGKEDSEADDVKELTLMASSHCSGRFTSYLEEARPYLGDSISDGSNQPDRAQSFVLQKTVEMQVERQPDDYAREMLKLCKILRACRRIVHFRDHRSGLLAGVFAIKEADAKQLEAKKHVHCEMKLVHEYVCGNIGPVFDYIGCTKLPCLRCWYTINKGSIFTTADKTHWKIYIWGCLMSEPPAPPALSRLEETNLELDEWLQDRKKNTSSADEPLQPESPVGW